MVLRTERARLPACRLKVMWPPVMEVGPTLSGAPRETVVRASGPHLSMEAGLAFDNPLRGSRRPE